MSEGMTGLAGRVALVTGGSGGIGSAICRAFARAGARVVVHYKSGEAAAHRLATELTATGATAVALQADLTDPKAVAALFTGAVEHLGTVDVLVNNAGSLPRRATFVDGSLELWRETFDLNLMAVVACCQAALRIMVPKGRGSIVNISSISGRTGGIPGESLHYGASKAALNALTRGLALEFASAGIRVNAVAPGLIDTSIHDRYREEFDKRIKGIPLHRAGTPEEIGDLAAYLASDRLSFMTGEVVYVAGGR